MKLGQPTKNGLMASFSFSCLNTLTLKFWHKYFSLLWWSNWIKKFHCFLYLFPLSSDLSLIRLLLNLYPHIVLSETVLVIKAFLLKRRAFTLTTISKKIAYKIRKVWKFSSVWSFFCSNVYKFFRFLLQ